MNRAFSRAALIAFLFSFCSISAFAQVATVKGVCKDAQGNPIADAQITWQNQDDGQFYKLKTNKKGEYFSLGVEIGKYTITLSKDGKVLDQQKNYQVGSGEVDYDIDLQKIQQQSVEETAKQEGVSAEEIKRQQAEMAAALQRNTVVKAVNDKLQAAIASMNSQPPDFDKAISILTEATQMAPNADVVWGDLGAAYLDSAAVQTDPQEKTKRNTEAYDSFKKAIELNPAATPATPPAQPAASSQTTPPEQPVTSGQSTSPGQPSTSGQSASPAQPAAPGQAAPPPASPPKPASPADIAHLANYYGSLGSAASRLGKNDEAAQYFQKAADLDPSKAGMYYFNLGVVLHNSEKSVDDRKAAIAALDKAIQVDPSRADAYFLKGTDLFGMSSTDSSGKVTSPPGTAEAFQKYLELQPNGAHAGDAKAMLAALGSTVETGFGSKKEGKKK